MCLKKIVVIPEVRRLVIRVTSSFWNEQYSASDRIYVPLRHSGGIVLDADRIYASITEILSSFALSTYLRADKPLMSTFAPG